jgi:hypothetical protein
MGNSDPGTEGRKNAKPFGTSIPEEMQEGMRDEYRRFVPMIEQVLKTITIVVTSENSLEAFVLFAWTIAPRHRPGA